MDYAQKRGEREGDFSWCTVVRGAKGRSALLDGNRTAKRTLSPV